MYCSNYYRNLVSDHNLIRLIRFVSQFTSKLCNSFLFRLDLLLNASKILFRCDSFEILNFALFRHRQILACYGWAFSLFFCCWRNTALVSSPYPAAQSGSPAVRPNHGADAVMRARRLLNWTSQERWTRATCAQRRHPQEQSEGNCFLKSEQLCTWNWECSTSAKWFSVIWLYMYTEVKLQ